VLLIRRAALSGLTELELCMCWKEALVVGWAFEVVFSSRLERSASLSATAKGMNRTHGVKGRSMGGSHVVG
jgi:hypothetical protein